MSAEPVTSSEVVHDYEQQADGGDLFVGADGVWPLQERLAETIDVLGGRGLQRSRRQAARLVDDDGITYGAGTDGRQGRNWVVDPLPLIIDNPEWSTIERGLQQRSQVLDLLLADLYGERRSIAAGIVPGEVVAAHPGFLRQVDGIRLPGHHQLVHVASDLGRSRTGEWVVFGDRADAPSGAGYAMATRRIISNVMGQLHRETPIARLRSFFHTMSASLLDAAPPTADEPRIVLLSPGAESETAYDQAFLATLLGLPMVESDDLFMHGGMLRRRTTTGDEVVDVVLRRVDADWCDPLDLRGGSRLGVPGMVEASRQGTLSVVNHLGAGVLENPGLTRVLPELTRFFLGEDPQLASVTTWWCGDPAERSHVLAHLDNLVVKPLARSMRVEPLFGSDLTAAQRETLVARITAEPWLWCAQEPVQFATTPVVRGERIEPREVVLRTFAVARADGYEVMPGALGRVARTREQRVISNATGALAKDVWVQVGDASTQPELPVHRSGGTTRHQVGLSSRSASNLFWLGRYAERAETTARLLRVSSDLAEDHARRPGSQGFTAMREVLGGVNRVLTLPGSGLLPAGDDFSDTPTRLRAALLDASLAGSVAFAANHVVSSAQAVREILSLDTWLVLARLERTLDDAGQDDMQLRGVLAQVQEALLAFAGITSQNMIRDESWAWIDLGTAIERAQLTVSLLRTTLMTQRSPNIDAMVTEAVLTAGESIITHRRRLASGTGPHHVVDSVFDLLWLDPTNPRSVVYQLERMVTDLVMVDALDLAERCRGLRARLEALDPVGLASGDRGVVNELANDLTHELRDISDTIEAGWMTRVPRVQLQPSDWGEVSGEDAELPTAVSGDTTTDGGGDESGRNPAGGTPADDILEARR